MYGSKEPTRSPFNIITSTTHTARTWAQRELREHSTPPAAPRGLADCAGGCSCYRPARAIAHCYKPWRPKPRYQGVLITSVSRDVWIELTSPEILLVSIASDSRLAPRVCLGSATIELIVSKRASTTALRYDPSYSKYGLLGPCLRPRPHRDCR